MEWKIYEKWLDITLYRQMTNLIYKLSSNEEKYKIYMQLKENDMFLEKPKVDMETAYGLHYPGEVLERIGEHLTLTKQTYRALGLALARMMPLQETCMFNGTQKDLFWKKMKQILGEKDLFLISINYICEEKEKNRWKQAMHAYPFERAEEMLFAMSILPDDETLWEGIKQKLADSFSKNRKISVFTEWNLFVWMVGKVMTKLKGYRKKDLDILAHDIRQDPLHQIQPFLGAKAGDHAHKGRILLNLQAAFLLERSLLHGLAAAVFPGEGDPQIRIPFRVVNLRVDAVKNARQHILAVAEKPVQPLSVVRGLDLLGIGFTDCRDIIRVHKSAFEHIGITLVLQFIRCKYIIRQTGQTLHRLDIPDTLES